MTSRELVLQTLEFENLAGRVPREIWTLPWARIHYRGEFDRILSEFPNDIETARPKYKLNSKVSRGDMYRKGIYVDDWGCVFENRQDGIIGEVKAPLVTGEEWEDWEKVVFPENWLSFEAEEVNRYCKSTDKFVLAGCYPRPFEQLQFIRGTENLFMDLMEPPDNMLKFMEKMHVFYCEQLTKWAKTDVDGLMIMDDWGTQENLLIHPKIWEKLFLPMYKDYLDIAKRYRKKMFMHSDGNILSILPKLVGIGLDAVNSQVFCMDFQELKKWKGKITFWGEIDRQRILPYGTAKETEKAVEQLMDGLWERGGVIAQLEFGLGAKPDNVRAAMKKWNTYGRNERNESDRY